MIRDTPSFKTPTMNELRRTFTIARREQYPIMGGKRDEVTLSTVCRLEYAQAFKVYTNTG